MNARKSVQSLAIGKRKVHKHDISDALREMREPGLQALDMCQFEKPACGIAQHNSNEAEIQWIVFDKENANGRLVRKLGALRSGARRPAFGGKLRCGRRSPH